MCTFDASNGGGSSRASCVSVLVTSKMTFYLLLLMEVSDRLTACVKIVLGLIILLHSFQV